jgi:hypothetical protein
MKSQPGVEFDEARQQIAQWADRQSSEKPNPSIRGFFLTLQGLLVYLLFASLVFGVLLEMSARMK